MNDTLKQAMDLNILVFDSDAEPGVFTKRLISLMKAVVKRNLSGNPVEIIMPSEITSDAELFGLSVSSSDEPTNYYRSSGASFPKDDENIVLMLTDKKEGLLGSF